MAAAIHATCQAQLPDECLIDAMFPQLLDAACILCAQPVAHFGFGIAGDGSSVPCREDEEGSLAELALEIIMSWKKLAQRCVLGFFAAYLITLQYSASTRPLEVPPQVVELADEMSRARGSAGFDLSPFPFWSEWRSLGAQLTFHANFFSLHLHQCNDAEENAEAVRGKYALRAGHDKPEYYCSVQTSDYQLVKRCRSRRRAQDHPGMTGYFVDALADERVAGWPARRNGPDMASIACPSDEAEVAFLSSRQFIVGATLAEAEAGAYKGAAEEASILEAALAEGDHRVAEARRKYGNRSTGVEGLGLGCETPGAEWKKDLGIFHKCILIVILERLQLPPRARVLDWGTGCGHKLTWAQQLYDIEGLGLELVEENARWARQHSTGKYCRVDGRFVDWLPDDYFDGIISYAALAHLEPDDQCRVIADLVGKLRVGGRMWFGWNAPGIWLNDSSLEQRWMFPAAKSWRNCFARAARGYPRWRTGEVAALWEVEEEAFIFPSDASRVETYLYWPPAYSLFVTRTMSGHLR